jgi:hypothetical protein
MLRSAAAAAAVRARRRKEDAAQPRPPAVQLQRRLPPVAVDPAVLDRRDCPL